MSAPRARTEHLVVEDVGDEVLIYDQGTDQAHCLTRDAAMVWRVCDGTSQIAEIAKALDLPADTVSRAVDELDACGLLEAAPTAGMTRRQATIRMAQVGGAAAAAPLVYSIMAPTPALAASQNFCLAVNNDCAPGNKFGCDACYKVGCVCCGEGTSGNVKLCTADCSIQNCNPCIVHAHCGGSGTDSSCTCGSSGVPNCTNINHIACPFVNSVTGASCCTGTGLNSNCATAGCG